jgi:D-amino-acid dehydrogenase
MTRVVVIGGGIAGLSCAYYLRRLDFEVTVVESNRVGTGASFANGGWLCPAQAGPLPEPGLTLLGMRALFDRDSALYFDPQHWTHLAPWLTRFWTYCNEQDHRAGTAAIARLGHDVFDLIEEMRADGVECELHKQGMVYAAKRPDDARAQLRSLQPMREHGYDVPDDIITGAELHELEPALSEQITAGFALREHWHVKPDTLTAGLAAVLRRDGVEIQEGAEVVELVRSGNRLTTVRTATWDVPADIVVLAAGAWTTALARSIGVAIPMEPGKGYSFYVRPSVMPQHAILLGDVHVGCTPYGDRIRIGGTMEFSGINSRLDQRRIDSIVTGARASFQPWQTPEIEATWAGMRPIPADGLPVLDRAGNLDNVYVATGHGMQGVTLAPPSGKLMAELIATGRRPEALEPFRLDRFPRFALSRVPAQANGRFRRGPDAA